MKKLVISLAKRTERRTHFEEKNSSLEDWFFFDATDKDILSTIIYDNDPIDFKRYMMELLTPSIKDSQPVYTRKTAMKLLALNTKGKERYIPDFSEDKTILGNKQWEWFEEQLKKKVDLRI